MRFQVTLHNKENFLEKDLYSLYNSNSKLLIPIEKDSRYHKKDDDFKGIHSTTANCQQ